MQKNFLLKLAAPTLAAIMLSSAAGAKSLAKEQEYKAGTFTDVADTAWYAAEVKSAYELGLMNGQSDTTFRPDGSVTVAEGITMASRLHAIYNGKTISEKSGGEWYDMYVEYAKNNGLIEDGQFASYKRNIMRYEMAQMFAKTLPAADFAAINEIKDIPDVAETEEYYDELMMLYKAGVVMGSDDYGNFYATSAIKRSEAAAIINRVALPENRKTGTLEEYGERDQAVFLIDDNLYGSAPHSNVAIGTGWTVENVGSTAFNKNGSTSHDLSDDSDKSAVYAHRDITVQTHGVVTTEIIYTTTGNGECISFKTSDGEVIFELLHKDGKLFVCGEKEYDTGFSYKNGSVRFLIKHDLDNGTVFLTADGKELGTYDIGKAKDLARLTVGTTKEAVVSLTLKETHMYVNYRVLDSFRTNISGNKPYGWDTTDNVTVATITDTYDSNVVKITGAGSASQKFDFISGKFVYETYVLVPKGQTASVALLNGGKEAVKVSATADGKFVSDGKDVRAFSENVWQLIRIEGNTETHKALIKINGKKCTEVEFKEDKVDEILITFDGKGDFKFDDVKLYNVYDYADYVPTPVPVTDDEWIVGMSVCSLWREGTHYGWTWIDGYPEAEPVIGYYDEGLPEVADWEIKFLVEHGYDFQHFCWYLGNLGNEPIKSTRLSSAIVDGYFNAKYSDMMDMCIMWENASCSYKNSDNFYKYLWPYWCDWYFSDERYLVIDNKPVLTIYQMKKFITDMGGEKAAAEVIAFMNEDIKKLGFDGMIIFGCGTFNGFKEEELRTYKNMGITAFVSYTFGENSYSAEYQKQRMTESYNTGILTLVPCIGVGFNDIGWTEGRTPNATPEAHQEVMEWAKNEYMPLIAEREKENSWLSKFVFATTWNEYGEGHYIMPAGLNSFGYVDANRAVFSSVAGTDDSKHFDVVPTDNQKARLGYLYANTHTSMKKLKLVENSISVDDNEYIYGWNFENQDDVKLWSIMMNCTNPSYDEKEKALCAETTTNDGAIKVTASIDANKAKYCRIVMKLEGDMVSGGDLFFKTRNDKDWTSSKGYSLTFTPLEENGYYEAVIDLSKNKYWEGTIESFRFDPSNVKSKFYVKSIGFYSGKSKNAYTINVDGAEMYIMPTDCVKTDKDVYVAGNPSEGFYSLQNIYYEWNRKNGRLYLKTCNGNEFEFFEGSDKATVDGKEYTLDRKIEVVDGLVSVPIYFIYDKSGIEYEKAENGVNISVRDGVREALETRVSNQWEFNVAGDMENWKIGCASGGVLAGNLYLVSQQVSSTASGYDPQISNTTVLFNSEMYKTLEMRLKTEFYDENHDSTVSVYFATNVEQNLSESKTVRCDLSKLTPDENGYYNITLDMSSNEKWMGNITTLRVDPTNSNGHFEFDYIRMIVDKELEEKLRKEEEEAAQDAKRREEGLAAADNGEAFYVENGDAEDKSGKTTATSHNSKVSIVEEDNGNHAYLVKNTTTEKQAWAYFVIPTRFKPGVTYKVEFDVKAVSDQNGNPVQDVSIVPNFRYSDVQSDGTVKFMADHPLNNVMVKSSTGGDWVHCVCEHTIGTESTDRANDYFTIFANPQGDATSPINMTYMVDNIVVTVVK